jgi:hypothetical protein
MSRKLPRYAHCGLAQGESHTQLSPQTPQPHWLATKQKAWGPQPPGELDGAEGVPLDAWPSQDAKRPRRASRLAGALRFRPGNKGGPCLSASDIYLPEMAP